MVDLLNNSYLQQSYGVQLRSALVCKRATGPLWKHGSSPPNFFNATLKVNWSERVMRDCWLMIYASRLCGLPVFYTVKSRAWNTGDITGTFQTPLRLPAAPLGSPSPGRALRDAHVCPGKAAGAEGGSPPPAFHALLEGAPRSAATALLITAAEN